MYMVVYMTPERRAYLTGKAREYREKKKYLKGVGMFVESASVKVSLEPSTGEIESVQSVEDLSCPAGYNKKMWDYAVERAMRARRYALRMPEQIRPGDLRFQSPEWQYQDQTRYPLPAGLLRD